MRAPTISIIIPTYKRPEELEICLKEILHQIQRNSYINEEIIVCDDEHCTSLQQKLTALSPEIRYVQGPQKGPASNRNAGAKMAQGQWLIFIDDDCIPEPGWLEAYRQSFVQHPAINQSPRYSACFFSDRIC
ncbi:MAG: hypothetical protein B7X06_03880 [Verrucomicrobia bacterium 21-51-4]|nr:MAG: hypothetical protein B7X06_03880 [Verrucomicrobia bacterium 21-51-4]